MRWARTLPTRCSIECVAGESPERTTHTRHGGKVADVFYGGADFAFRRLRLHISQYGLTTLFYRVHGYYLSILIKFLGFARRRFEEFKIRPQLLAQWAGWLAV